MIEGHQFPILEYIDDAIVLAESPEELQMMM